MHKINLLLCLLSLNFMWSQSIKAPKITIEEFSLKGISIRAIDVVDNETIWFAGSHGKFGRIKNNEISIDSIQHQGKPVFFRSIAFNGQYVYLLSIENPALLYQVNPYQETLGTPKLVYQEQHDKVFYDAMTFFDQQHGIAMGDPTENCFSVITTIDGGHTWQKLNCKTLPKTFEGEAAFAASNGNLATYNSTVWMVSGGKKSRVYKSENYGKSWQVYDTPMAQGDTMTGIYTVDFYNDKEGIIMGGDWNNKSKTQNAKALTKNGGKSWQLVSDDNQPGYISSVKYIPNTNGQQLIAVSTQGIYYSSNAGVHWQKISNHGFYSIRFINKNSAWLSGHEKIAKLTLQ